MWEGRQGGCGGGKVCLEAEKCSGGGRCGDWEDHEKNWKMETIRLKRKERDQMYKGDKCSRGGGDWEKDRCDYSSYMTKRTDGLWRCTR